VLNFFGRERMDFFGGSRRSSEPRNTRVHCDSFQVCFASDCHPSPFIPYAII
jgi:hypothetical protein